MTTTKAAPKRVGIRKIAEFSNELCGGEITTAVYASDDTSPLLTRRPGAPIPNRILVAPGCRALPRNPVLIRRAGRYKIVPSSDKVVPVLVGQVTGFYYDAGQ